MGLTRNFERSFKEILQAIKTILLALDLKIHNQFANNMRCQIYNLSSFDDPPCKKVVLLIHPKHKLSSRRTDDLEQLQTFSLVVAATNVNNTLLLAT